MRESISFGGNRPSAKRATTSGSRCSPTLAADSLRQSVQRANSSSADRSLTDDLPCLPRFRDAPAQASAEIRRVGGHDLVQAVLGGIAARGRLEFLAHPACEFLDRR